MKVWLHQCVCIYFFFVMKNTPYVPGMVHTCIHTGWFEGSMHNMRFINGRSHACGSRSWLVGRVTTFNLHILCSRGRRIYLLASTRDAQTKVLLIDFIFQVGTLILGRARKLKSVVFHWSYEIQRFSRLSRTVTNSVISTVLDILRTENATNLLQYRDILSCFACSRKTIRGNWHK